MRVSKVKELFRTLTAKYFAGAEVTFTRQSRVAKPQLPLVTITQGNVRRPLSPVYEEENGFDVGNYTSRISLTVDLFTHGQAVVDDETGEPIAYEDTAVDDMLWFVDFLGSQYTIDWCHRNDVAILVDGDVRDLTGIINDDNYEYRSQITVMMYFTQKAVGYTATLLEESIASGTPIYRQTSSGGGTKELSEKESGYFTEAEIKEEE